MFFFLKRYAAQIELQVRSSAPKVGCLFHYWGKKDTLFPIFCQWWKNPENSSSITPLLHTSSQKNSWVRQQWRISKIHDGIAREEGRRCSGLYAGGKLRQGIVLANRQARNNLTQPFRVWLWGWGGPCNFILAWLSLLGFGWGGGEGSFNFIMTWLSHLGFGWGGGEAWLDSTI